VATREVNSESTSGAVRADPARAPESALSNGSIEAERQREEFGGLNWGAAFFGWLVAVGIAAILTAFISAAGAAIGLTHLSSTEATKNAATIGIGGAIALLIVLLLAYYAGGYVAGRMSRFDGGRQGFGAWLIGVIITVLFGAAGAILGSKYNVLSALKLPRIPVQEGTLATGAAITLAAIVLGTLIAAILGGRIGRRYHRKVDRVAVT
jgi:ABC-type amino acid transport system permease subunit